MFMSIGYSAINSVTGDISGTVTAKVQDGVFITDVEQTSDVDANLTNSKIKNYVGTLMGSTVELSKDNPSSEITYKVIVYNNANETMQFSKVIYDESLDVSYDNPDITFEISGFTVGQTIEPNETKEIIIKFKYKDQSSVPENTVLNSYIQFKMTRINRMVLAQYGSNTSKYLTGTILRNQIESVKFEQGKEPTSTDIIEKFDASEKQDESIIGYYTDHDSNGLYELTFVSENTIYANKNAGYLFQNLNNVQKFEFDNFSTYGVTSFFGMFQQCSNLEELELGTFDTSNVTTMLYMFSECSKLKVLDVSGFNTSHVKSMANMFIRCEMLTQLDLDSWDTAKVQNMQSMFEKCKNLENLNVSNFDTSNVTVMAFMFRDCTKLTQLNVSSWNTSLVEKMNYVFNDCPEITELDLSKWNTSNVTNMSGMFGACKKLEKLDVEKFDTSNVENMSRMFQECNKLKILNVSNFDTSNVTDISYMFLGCSNIENLDLSSFNTNNTKNMQDMIANCKNLKTIYVSEYDSETNKGWSTSSVTNSANMFNNSLNLVGGNGTTYDSNHLDATYARIDTADTPGYFTDINNKT